MRRPEPGFDLKVNDSALGHHMVGNLPIVGISDGLLS